LIEATQFHIGPTAYIEGAGEKLYTGITHIAGIDALNGTFQAGCLLVQ
jgi:hypothetical protein